MEGVADIPPPPLPEPTSGRRHIRRASFEILNSDAFAMFFLIVSLCFFFVFIVCPFYSFSFHFSKPHSARKSLDFLGVALVLFAIACGLLSRDHGENRIHEEVYRATSNVSEQNQKSNPSIPNQWRGYSDRTDQILLPHSPEVAGIEYWRLSDGPYMTNYQSPSLDSLQHCRNLPEFEEELGIKRGGRATFSVHQEEISSSSSALHQFSVPPLMTPPQLSSPPPPRAVVAAEVERVNEGVENFEPPLLLLDFQASEDEISKNEKQREAEGEESKRKKKNKKKKKTKQRQKGVESFNDLLAPQRHHRNSSPPPAAVHHFQTSINIGETRKEYPAPPQSPPQKHIAERTQNSTGGQGPPVPVAPPYKAAELQTVVNGEYLGTRNENSERKGPMFCPSPDVNSKADSFIERFREGLKLERMNSIKERQRMKRTSILGRKGPEL